jgi:hypothetical protein
MLLLQLDFANLSFPPLCDLCGKLLRAFRATVVGVRVPRSSDLPKFRSLDHGDHQITRSTLGVPSCPLWLSS